MYLREERFVLAHSLGDTVHHCTECMMARAVSMVVGACGMACYISADQDAESEAAREACLQTSNAGAVIFGEGAFVGK